jgi:hypothetical protein
MIENNKFSVRLPIKAKSISDRDAALRRMPNKISWHHKMVEDLIKGKIEDPKIRAGVIAKLKQTPDGALEKFVQNIDNKIAQVIEELNPLPKSQESKSEVKQSSGISAEVLLNIKNSMQLDAPEDAPDESSDKG